MAGLSMARLAQANGISSRSTISNWELYTEEEMKPYQVKMLMNAIPADVFQESRRRWQEKLEKEEQERKKPKGFVYARR
jgi:transcriptional regulator with XRE-family HTH domain